MSDPEKAPRPEEDSALRLETGSYILRSLIKDVVLSGDGAQHVEITCVEVWNGNLYIGTSAGEVIHHVEIPPDPDDLSSHSAFIQASRLEPPVNQNAGAGIQQILLLPGVNKACILSNNTLNFYSLPELSPAFPQMKPLTCGWIGGPDLDTEQGQMEGKDGVVIMMCLRNKIRLVKIGQEAPFKIRDIEFGGCLATVRRGDFACVADARSYALLDVVHQQKIPLTSISTVDDQPAEQVGTGTLADDAWPTNTTVSRSSSSAGNHAANRLTVQDRGHTRASSLGVFKTDSAQLGNDLSRPSSTIQRHGFDVPPGMRQRTASPSQRPPLAPERRGSEGARSVSLSKPLPATPVEPASSQASAQPSPVKAYVPLKPIIASPTPSEFLLANGTAPSEPGVGMFVNVDGEVVRGSMEFASYPIAVVVDGKGIDMSASQAGADVQEEGFVLAVVRREQGRDIEIQRWDVDPGEASATKEWLGVTSRTHGVSSDDASKTLGIRSMAEKVNISLPDITNKLALKVINLSGSINDKKLDSRKSREKQEAEFVARLCRVDAHIALWVGNEVHWMVRNPMVLKLDARLRLAQATSIATDAPIGPQRELIEVLINDIRGFRSQTELEFFTLAYIRQKAAMLLFMDLVLRTIAGAVIFEHDKRSTEEILIESELDPRFVLAFLPETADEVLQGPEGVWVQGGFKDLIEQFQHQADMTKMPTDPAGPLGDNLLHLIKRYLLFWRRKKGNPSVVDGKYVFPSVDAALLRILLLLDQQTPPGVASPSSTRAELYSVVDSGVDGFDRALELLEQHKRLYVISRLYQSRKQSSKVLATWKRIISGEEDLGGEFTEGEQELRTYLSKLRNRQVVEEYGTWLANRNPKLGVQVFADDNSKTTWAPAEALALLREKAPAAVKEYLEYLVFAKKQPQHINELIAYYLDIVLNELSSSEESRSILAATYETYRALRGPKPTYRQFISDNAMAADWWHSRLRLLQLLGGNQGAASSYDVGQILKRLGRYEGELVPEMIILNGRQGRHEEAIRLLTHGLGDFDMAISYCLRGGSSIFGSLADSISGIPYPTHDEQAKLFGYLLTEFLRIEDVTDRIERTGELLERFGAWYDVSYVLSILPDSWSIEIFSGFLISALRRLVREKSETTIVKALSGAENLKSSADFIEKSEEVGPVIERVA
ncbi:TGF beta receptor associated protein-like protein 1 [Venturia nashicola]|nr:TGF beta receptor associated protein-like protein 1 [Venturia nashicola]